jgi:hypothetical protein
LRRPRLKRPTQLEEIKKPPASAGGYFFIEQELPCGQNAPVSNIIKIVYVRTLQSLSVNVWIYFLNVHSRFFTPRGRQEAIGKGINVGGTLSGD